MAPSSAQALLSERVRRRLAGFKGAKDLKILVTGTAGFIGAQLAHRLLERGDEVIGVDSVNDYYDVNLKEARLARLTGHPGFTEVRQDVADRAVMADIFAKHRPERVVHLAAQAGEIGRASC